MGKVDIVSEDLQVKSVENRVGYKKTTLGYIPKDWEIKKFVDITSILRCGIASTPTYVEKGVPFLSSQNVKENKVILDKFNYISQDFHEKLTEKDKPQRGDILYTRVGASFGKAAVVEFDWEFSVYVSLTLIRMKKGYDNYFYSYLLNSGKYVYIARRIVFQGGGVQNLNVKEVEKFDMVVPPIKEQQKIASILSTWDKTIELKEKLIEQKKEQKKGLMQKLLTGEVRLPGFDGEWSEVRLDKIAEIIMGQSPKSESYNDIGKGLPLIQGNADCENRKTQPRLWTSSPTKQCEIGDIIMTVRAPVGYVSRSFHKACVGRGVCAIRGKINQDFLYYQLIFKEGLWGRISQGSTFDSVNSNDIKGLIVSVPTEEEQKAISNILAKADREIHLLEKENDVMKEQKKGLMQNLLTGKIRVKV